MSNKISYLLIYSDYTSKLWSFVLTHYLLNNIVKNENAIIYL